MHENRSKEEPQREYRSPLSTHRGQPVDVQIQVAEILDREFDATAAGLRGEIMANQPRDVSEMFADILGWD